MLDAYRDGQLDRVLLVNATFVNTMTQKPRAQQLLPVRARSLAGDLQHAGTTSTSRAKAILDGVLMRYVESFGSIAARSRTSPARWRRAWSR